MNLFNYLMNKKGKKLVDNNHMLEYLLNKQKGNEKEVSGTEINITDVTKAKIIKLTLDKESTQTGTPTPDNPVEVKTVKGYRNLLNLSDFSTQTISGITLTKNSNNSISINGTSTSPITLDIPITDIELTTGKTYRIYQNNTFTGSNYAVSLRDSVKNVVDTSCSLDSATSSKTFTVSSNKIAKYFRIYIVTGKTINTTIYPMITESNAIFPYVPYGTNWVYTKITNGTDTNYYTIPLNDNEIAGIGDYKDELIVDRNGHCWLNKKTSKVVLNGNESGWSNATISSIGNRYYNHNILINSVDNVGLCNYLGLGIYSERNNNPGSINNLFYIGDNYLQIRRDDITTLNDFRTWLSNYNPIVYYTSTTEQLIDLNYTADIRLFNGVNNITNSDDMDMTLIYK